MKGQKQCNKLTIQFSEIYRKSHQSFCPASASNTRIDFPVKNGGNKYIRCMSFNETRNLFQFKFGRKIIHPPFSSFIDYFANTFFECDRGRYEQENTN